MKDLLTFIISLFRFDATWPMNFNYFNFWAFFLLVFAGYVILQNSQRKNPSRKLKPTTIRNGYLALVSILFYYRTSNLYFLLLIFSTIMGYYIGIHMDRQRDAAEGVDADNAKGYAIRRKALMILGIVVNLSVLFYFKYAYFFTDIHNTIFHSDHQVVNWFAQFANNFYKEPHFNASKIVLPVGISFYTFQNISYIVDVYKGKVRHVDNILDFAFYATFFPQLVAGPIIRADQFVPQIYKPYFLGKRQWGMAIFWILNGLAKKIIMADYLAANFVDKIFDEPTMYNGYIDLAALFVYSLQVYADFSGYTDIAIGIAMLMGFYLPKNFNSPYKATNTAGFWKRWHISLSNWLKDYLYIPIGGNRKATLASYLILGGMLASVALMAQTWWVTLIVASVAGILVAVYIIFPRHRKEMKTNINNMDTMLLGGLWHGASFNFITWGGLNGLGILIYKWWKQQGPRVRVVSTELIFALTLLADLIWPYPVLNLATVWTGIIAIGTALRYLLVTPVCRALKKENISQKIDTVWNIFQTFVFITFTRLFFRCGSNQETNPAEANEQSWENAKLIINEIGKPWDFSMFNDAVNHFGKFFLVFVLGMIIHWLPDNFKRRYRIWFATMPRWAMIVVVVLAVFVMWQFVPLVDIAFIYFQF